MKSDFWYFGCEKKNPPQVAFVSQRHPFEFGADAVRRYPQAQTSKLVFRLLLSSSLILTLLLSEIDPNARVDFSFQPHNVSL